MAEGGGKTSLPSRREDGSPRSSGGPAAPAGLVELPFRMACLSHSFARFTVPAAVPAGLLWFATVEGRIVPKTLRVLPGLHENTPSVQGIRGPCYP